MRQFLIKQMTHDHSVLPQSIGDNGSWFGTSDFCDPGSAEFRHDAAGGADSTCGI